MKIMIFGSRGQLGSDLTAELKDIHELLCVKREVDITDMEKVEKQITSFQPKIVINSAAYTDVDGCERDQERAFSVNAFGAQNIAQAAQKSGACVLYISTDYVFDGQKGKPYHEYDLTSPLNSYGLSKLAGEEATKTYAERFYIIRTSWLHGLERKNFIKTIIEKAQKENELRIVDDQIGSPTFTKDLSKMIIKIINTDRYGLYHVVNEGSNSWFGLATEALELYGLKEVKVLPVKTEEFESPALRPKYSVLDNYNIRQLGLTMRSYREALKDFIVELKNVKSENK